MEQEQRFTEQKMETMLAGFDAAMEAIKQEELFLPKECEALAFAYIRRKYGTAAVPGERKELMLQVAQILEKHPSPSQRSGKAEATRQEYVRLMLDPDRDLHKKAARYFQERMAGRSFLDLTLTELDELYEQTWLFQKNPKTRRVLFLYRGLCFPTELRWPGEGKRRTVTGTRQRWGDFCFSQVLWLWLAAGDVKIRALLKEPFSKWLRVLLEEPICTPTLYEQFDPMVGTGVIRPEICKRLMKSLDESGKLLSEAGLIPQRKLDDRIMNFLGALEAEQGWQTADALRRPDVAGILWQLRRMTELSCARTEEKEERRMRCARLLCSLLKCALAGRELENGAPCVETTGDLLVYVLLDSGAEPSAELLGVTGYDALYRLELKKQTWDSEDDNWILRNRECWKIRRAIYALEPRVLLGNAVLRHLLGVFLREDGTNVTILREKFPQTGRFLPEIIETCAAALPEAELLAGMTACGIDGRAPLAEQIDALRPKELLRPELPLSAAALLWHLHYWRRLCSQTVPAGELAVEVLGLYETHWPRMLALLQYVAGIEKRGAYWECLYDQETAADRQKTKNCRFYAMLLESAGKRLRRNAPYQAYGCYSKASQIYLRFDMLAAAEACSLEAERLRNDLPPRSAALNTRPEERLIILKPYANSLYDSTGGADEGTAHTEFAERIIQCQVTVLLGNQIVDQPLILDLVENKAFLELIHDGFVTLSLFGGLRTLRGYLESCMANPEFWFTNYPQFNMANMEANDPARQFAKRLRTLAVSYLKAFDAQGRMKVLREMSLVEKELVLDYVEKIARFDEALLTRKDLLERYHQTSGWCSQTVRPEFSEMVGSHLDLLRARTDRDAAALELYANMAALNSGELGACENRSDYMNQLNVLEPQFRSEADRQLLGCFKKLLDIIYIKRNAAAATPNIHCCVEKEYALLLPEAQEEREDAMERELVRQKRTELAQDRDALDLEDLVRYIREVTKILEDGSMPLSSILHIMANDRRVAVSQNRSELDVGQVRIAVSGRRYEMREKGGGNIVEWTTAKR